jgi:hypothetical protein
MKHLRSGLITLILGICVLVLPLACAHDRDRSKADSPSTTRTTAAAATTATTKSATKPASKPVVAKWSMRPLTKDEVNLIVVGDFGNGKDTQKQVAKTMAAYVEKVGTQFDALLTVGDNFYVKLAKGVDDYEFQSVFEDAYDAKRINFPFYLTPGNHDYEPGRPDRTRGEKYKAEIEREYARKHPNSRLKYPAKWYRLDFPQGSGTPLVTALMFDSNKPHLTQQEWDDEKKWMADQLAATKAPWRLTAAHHPFFSNGSHGDNGVMQVEWGPILTKGGLDFYCAGHDHDLQHLQRPGWPMSFIQAGAGGQPITDMRWDSRGPFSRKLYGFVHMRFTPTLTHVKYIEAKDGKIVHYFTRDNENTVRVIHTTGRDKATTKPLKTLLGIPASASKPATTQSTR